MPKFNLELAYTLGSYARVQVEAETLEEACVKALEDPPYDDFEDCAESSSDTYVSEASEGQLFIDDHLEVPFEYSDKPVLMRWIGVPRVYVVQGIHPSVPGVPMTTHLTREGAEKLALELASLILDGEHEPFESLEHAQTIIEREYGDDASVWIDEQELKP